MRLDGQQVIITWQMGIDKQERRAEEREADANRAFGLDLERYSSNRTQSSVSLTMLIELFREL